ncbi:radical SAM protein [Roseibium sp. AS2]|uniref:B12-binding domain-containing radical SAM protein n=1 Tax=Roseibium sp. AS2 TaxID=3135781 RepID=UPI00317F5600
MARVLIINLASLPMPGNEPIFPIGARCVEDALRFAGHFVRLMDFVESPQALDDFSWLNDAYDIVAFAIRNIDPIDLSCDGHVLEYARFAERVHAALDPKQTGGSRPLLVAGGPGFSLFAKSLVDLLGVDLGISGPAETIMLEVAADPGAFLGSGSILQGRRYDGFVERVLTHPPALMRAYANTRNAMIGVETMRRTCFQKCIYCPYAHITGNNSGDYKPLALMAAEIDAIHGAGFRRIFFTDSIFNSQRAAKDIACLLGGSDFPDLTWSAYFSPKPFDDAFAGLLAKSGLETVVISPDSLDAGMMRNLGKNFDLASVEKFLKRCRAHGLTPMVNIVFGGPGETRETVRNTARFINENLRAGELSMHVGYRILPQTALSALTGLTEPDLLAPTFYPIEEQIVQWLIQDLDSRFLTPSVMVNLLAGRAAARRMRKIPATALRGETSDGFSHVALSREPA